MKKIFLLGLVALIASGLSAAVVSVNCAQGSSAAPYDGQTLLPTENAGLAGYEAANWNNIQLDAVGTELVDDGGAATGSVVNFLTSNGWGDGTADGTVDPPNDKIARGYFDDGETSIGIGVDIEVTNVPYDIYTVVIYLSTDWGTGFTEYTVNGVTKTTTIARDTFANIGGWVEDQNALVFKNITGTTLDIEVLERLADGDIHTRGCVAGFQILEQDSEYPVILAGPVDVTVAAGDTAIFTVEAITTDSYQWYYSADGVTSSPISGAITNVLTVTGVMLSDEGYYYCDAIRNSATVSSDSARLMTKRLVAHWAFDGDLSESVDGWVGKLVDSNTANPDPIPVFDVGVDGTSNGAIKFSRNTWYVEVLGSQDYFNFFPQGQTVNLWVKSDSYEGVVGFMYLIEKRVGSMGWAIYDTAFYYGQGIGVSIYPLEINPPGGRLDDDNWHMITVTYDANTQSMTLYQDGEFSGTVVGAVNTSSTAPLKMGGRYPNGDLFSGLLDDVSIRSYPIGPYEVAEMYTDVMTEESICVEYPEFDFSGDCLVDLSDFAIFASGWLDCSPAPDCQTDLAIFAETWLECNLVPK